MFAQLFAFIYFSKKKSKLLFSYFRLTYTHRPQKNNIQTKSKQKGRSNIILYSMWQMKVSTTIIPPKVIRPPTDRQTESRYRSDNDHRTGLCSWISVLDFNLVIIVWGFNASGWAHTWISADANITSITFTISQTKQPLAYGLIHFSVKLILDYCMCPIDMNVNIIIYKVFHKCFRCTVNWCGTNRAFRHSEHFCSLHLESGHSVRTATAGLGSGGRNGSLDIIPADLSSEQRPAGIS